VNSLAKIFGEQIAAFGSRLNGVGEHAANREVRPGGWCGKEVLGHLIDSALNNHQRFVRAALEGGYVGPGYDQGGWVTLHGYADLPWHELLDHWREKNSLLVRVVERIPDHRLGAPCRVGDSEPVTLGFLIEDYLRHLGHHVEQIEKLRDETA
jgi:hypothetical protein